jgi:hypothetical protein
MAKTTATVLGIVFLLIGAIGFFVPSFLGTHLTLGHNVVHLVTGAVSLWLGLKGSLGAAKTFCIVFGIVYALLGVAGFLAGGGADRMMTVIPGQLELGTMDHIVHILFGLIYLIGGIMTRAAGAPAAAPSRP